MNLYFTSEIRDCLDLFGTQMALVTCYSYIYNDGGQFQLEIRAISRRRGRSRPVNDAELVSKTRVLKGSLTTRVFETRTPTGREDFACLDRTVSQICILLIFNGENILSNVNMVV